MNYLNTETETKVTRKRKLKQKLKSTRPTKQKWDINENRYLNVKTESKTKLCFWNENITASVWMRAVKMLQTVGL